MIEKKELDLRIIEKVVIVMAIAMGIFQVVSAYFLLPAMEQRGIHLAFALLLIFLLNAEKKSRVQRIFDLVLAIAGFFASLYVYNQYVHFITDRAGALNTTDIVVGLIIMVLVIEATRRTTGLTMAILAIIGIAYTVWGHLLPGDFGHSYVRLNRIIQGIGLGTEGVFGSVLGISASVVAVFIIFAYTLSELGAGEFFMDLARALFGSVRGGPAKIAVVASCFMGMLSGSPTANVVTTGSFTIPLMKKTGYKDYFAAAVEACASSGGNIMPPIMGAAAFLMADFLSIPYVAIIKAALIPALLYYLSIFAMVDIEAVKGGLKGTPKSENPKLGTVLKEGWVHLLAPCLLVYLMVFPRLSLGRSAFWSLVAMIVIAFLHPKIKMDFSRLLNILKNGSKGVLQVAAICACAGILIGSLTVTGLGLKLSSIMISMAGGNLVVLLIYTGIAAIILGMGMPTTGIYIIAATLIAPALIEMGIAPLSAHLFVFYYGTLSVITPPVAVAAYAGASIAESDPWKTGWVSFRIAAASYLVPFMFVFWPYLLLEGSWPMILTAIITAVLGVFSLAFSLQGHILISPISLVERIILFAAAIALLTMFLELNIAALVVVAAIFVRRYLLNRKNKAIDQVQGA